MMKHYDLLSSIDKQIVELEIVESLLQILGTSDQLENSDVRNVVWKITDQLHGVNSILSEQFYQLWNDIRDDCQNEPDTSGENDYTKPSTESDQLHLIVDSWVRQSQSENFVS